MTIIKPDVLYNIEYSGIITEVLTREELTTLYNYLLPQHIPYDNYELVSVVRKIREILDDNSEK